MEGVARDVSFLSILAIVFGVAYIVTRLVLVLLDIHRKRKTPGYGKNKRKSSIKTMVVVGSGSLLFSCYILCQKKSYGEVNMYLSVGGLPFGWLPFCSSDFGIHHHSRYL